WGIPEARPYLRARLGLANSLWSAGRREEAIGHLQEMLRLTPDDNQGVRYLIGAERLRIGDNEGAIVAFGKCLHEEVGCAFGLALAKLRARGPSAEIGEALVTGFAANRYVTPMLLGETWERLDAFHGTNMAEPEWAHDVIVAQADLWQAVPRGAELLRVWWMATPVVSWRRKLDEIMIRLKDLPASNARSAAVSEWSALQSEPVIRELVRSVRAAS
ncbi:MAG TPA: hypothetical protein VFX59_18900, partial [Polyangiales bacterium]|nr:hypothetical protein [Polyangiales bacterium]